MLDVHPPHTPTHTWRDFFIHIATIVVGLVIAVGLEQTVEAIHHLHQASELVESMRSEARQNIPALRESEARLDTQSQYMASLSDALLQARPLTQQTFGQQVLAHGVTPPRSSIVYLSPSRAAWLNAQSSGVAALLPTDQAFLYARLDRNTLTVMDGEETMLVSVKDVAAECAAAHYIHTDPAPQAISVAHRDELLLRIERAQIDIDRLGVIMRILEGGDEAVDAGAKSLSSMYTYQNAVLARVTRKSDLSLFYAGDVQLKTDGTQPPPDK